MRKLFFIISIVAVIFFMSCSNSVGIHDTAPSGAYLYTSYDTTGNAIVKGWFTMEYQDSTRISGNWNFEKIGNPQDIGPQVGLGVLVGDIRQGKVYIELNPQFKDNNLQLLGIIEDNKYSGEWVYTSYIGITNRGMFNAIKK